MSDTEKHVRDLITKAAETRQSDDAMRYSQAACNAANALAQLQNIKRQAA